jgi:hypothetical protein
MYNGIELPLKVLVFHSVDFWGLSGRQPTSLNVELGRVGSHNFWYASI